MFEEDCEMSVDRLICGWMAEGFIRGDEGRTLHEQGEGYIRELISRSFIQPVEVDAGGKVLSCRVHDMMLGFIVSLSAEANFATILDGQQGRSLPKTLHRLSIQGNNPLPQVRLSHLRSLVVSGHANLIPSLSELGNLRVLDLGGCSYSLQNDHLKGIESLFLLRYLVVGGNCITDIPKEIGNLVFLQTLDLRASSVKELPGSIVRARRLRCLRVNRHTKIPDGILKMEGLEELGDINISKPELLKELCNLTKLMVLGIAIWSWDESSYGDALLGYMRSLVMSGQNIQSLSILTCCSLEFLDKLHAEWAPPRLRKLEIRHIAFVAMPGWICSVEDLSSLSIEVHKLSDEMIGMLGQLHSLCSLSLTYKHAPEPEARFSKCTGGFRKLTSFHFVSNAMGKIFEPGATLILQRLKLSSQASRTKDVSRGFDFGLEDLSSLEHVRVEINCFNASLRVVEEAEAAIGEAIYRGRSRRPNVEIQRVREEDMVE